jgi:hypothetical protein
VIKEGSMRGDNKSTVSLLADDNGKFVMAIEESEVEPHNIEVEVAGYQAVLEYYSNIIFCNKKSQLLFAFSLAGIIAGGSLMLYEELSETNDNYFDNIVGATLLGVGVSSLLFATCMACCKHNGLSSGRLAERSSPQEQVMPHGS